MSCHLHINVTFKGGRLFRITEKYCRGQLPETCHGIDWTNCFTSLVYMILLELCRITPVNDFNCFCFQRKIGIGRMTKFIFANLWADNTEMEIETRSELPKGSKIVYATFSSPLHSTPLRSPPLSSLQKMFMY